MGFWALRLQVMELGFGVQGFGLRSCRDLRAILALGCKLTFWMCLAEGYVCGFQQVCTARPGSAAQQSETTLTCEEVFGPGSDRLQDLIKPQRGVHGKGLGATWGTQLSVAVLRHERPLGRAGGVMRRLDLGGRSGARACVD